MAMNYSAEGSLIGALLIEPRLIGEIMQRVKTEDFGDPKLRTLYDAARSLWQSGRPVDAVTVSDTASSALGSASADTVRDCMTMTPTAASWEIYADIVRSNAQLRRVQLAAMEVLDADSLETASKAVSNLNRAMTARPDTKVVGMKSGMAELLARLEQGKRPEYITWGIRQLNEQLYAEKGDLVVLGGLPSSGKTMLASQFATHMARTYRVGFFSLETSDAKLYARIAAQDAGISFKSIKKGELSSDELRRLRNYISELEARGLRLDVIPAAGMTVSDIRSVSLANRYDVIFIDYLQIVGGPGEAGSYERATAVSIDLHRMSQSCSIMVVALSQLSRAEKGAGRKPRDPQMSDLRSSGQIEQDADAVMMLSMDGDTGPAGPRRLSVVKNKEGERGTIRLKFDSQSLTLRPLANYEPPKWTAPPKMQELPESDQYRIPDEWRGEDENRR